MRIKNIYDTYLLATDRNWTAGVGDDDTDVTLAILVDIRDMYDATGEEEFKNAPITVSFSLMVAKPHESFFESDDGDNIDLILDTHSYCGGVPIDHDFLSTDRLNKNLTSKLLANEATIITSKLEWGTVAAQRGRGSSFTYPMFKTNEAAEKWARAMLKEYSSTLLTLVGFLLDRPINLLGETGWRTIELQAFGKERVRA